MSLQTGRTEEGREAYLSLSCYNPVVLRVWSLDQLCQLEPPDNSLKVKMNYPRSLAHKGPVLGPVKAVVFPVSCMDVRVVL